MCEKYGLASSGSDQRIEANLLEKQKSREKVLQNERDTK